MRFRRPVAIAASIIVLALVVPFTLHLTLTPRVAHRVAPQDELGGLARSGSASHTSSERASGAVARRNPSRRCGPQGRRNFMKSSGTRRR